MLLKTNKKNKNIEINSLKECEDIIIKSNVIKNQTKTNLGWRKNS